MTALLPPDPSVSGWYWISNRGGTAHPKWWDAHAAGWYVPGSNLARWTPDFAAASGFTLATPHRLPTAEELDAVYALTVPPGPAKHPVGSYAMGFYAGMAYAARKLAEALGCKP